MRHLLRKETLGGMRASVISLPILVVLPFQQTHAADLLGAYVGGAIGESRVKADVSGSTAGDFRESDSAFKVMIGIRPLSWVGAELTYIDPGHPSGSIGGSQASVATKGAAAFGVLYLPNPLPAFDVYAKAGLARLQNRRNDKGVSGSFPIDSTNANFAAGLGAQFKIRSWAIRAEYEEFIAADAHPSLLSFSPTWTFV